MRIDEYFSAINEIFAESPFISHLSVETDKRSDFLGLIKGLAVFIDGSELHFREFIDLRETECRLKYKYQYQSSNKSLIFRYDNIKHHREIESFPHHKHLPDLRIVDSDVPELSEILDEIINSLDITQG